MATQILGTGAGYRFQEWLRAQVRDGDKAPALPKSKADVEAYQAAVRKRLEAAAGPRPEYDALDAEVHQAHDRDGYRVEAVSFNTFAGLRMTATAYVPEASDPVPGVLAVHGHSAHGRRVPGEQRRAAALAKRGYFVLSVDCFGSGERAVTLPGQYHGSLDAAALWLTGTSLFGVQIHENVRACDYLVSRPEVDSERLAISGASGGGNQTWYAAAWEPRFKVVVPVVSVGSYHEVVATSNCMCETPFGLAGALEQYDVLSLIAPRPLLVMNAMDDGINFRPEDAGPTVEKASEIWGLLGASDKIAFKAFPTVHGYHPPMREACHGWFDRWLQGADSHDPVPEPEVQIEDYESISCYPVAEEPQVKTIRRFFVDRRDKALAEAKRPSPDSLKRLLKVELDGPPLRVEHFQRMSRQTGIGKALHSEDGLVVPVWEVRKSYESTPSRVCIYVGDDKDASLEHPSVQHVLAEDWLIWAADLPGLGESILPYEAPRGHEHNATRASHMLGFTLTGLWLRTLGQMVASARQAGAAEVVVFASGAAATPALIGASLLEGADRLVVEGPLASFSSGDAFDSVSMAAMVPGLLQLGDIAQLASLRAPVPLTVVAPVNAHGEPISAAERKAAFEPVRTAYAASDNEAAFHVLGPEEGSQARGWWVS